MPTTTLLIPSSRVYELQVRIEKFNRRAIKLNLLESKLTLVTESPFLKKVLDENDRKVSVSFTPVIIDGDLPIIKGWKFASVIDHIDSNTHIVKSISEDSIPESYRTRGPVCDHCHTNRPQRKQTFVLKNSDSGEYIQVGRACLKDFVNTSVDSELAYLTSYLNMTKEFNEYDSFSSADYRVSLVDAFMAAIKIIDAVGFVSSQSESHCPTKIELFTYFYGQHKEQDELFSILTLDTEVAIKKANLIIDWIKNNPNNNEFFYNLKALVGQEIIDPKYFGYIAGAVSAYLKEMETIAAEKIQINNEFLNAQIGKRIILKNVKIKNVFVSQGYYGTTWIHKMLDSDNHSLVWFSSSANLSEIADPDQPITIKATVKKFDEYKDIKQTVLTRVSVVN